VKAKGYQKKPKKQKKQNRHRNLNELVFAANSYEKCELTQAETKCKTRGKKQLSVRQNLEQNPTAALSRLLSAQRVRERDREGAIEMVTG
jgi:hypothetical protein